MALSTRNSTHRGSHSRGVARGQSNHAGPSDWLPVSLVPALFKEHMWTRPEEVTAGTLKPEEFSKRLLAAAFSWQKYYFSSVINSWQHAILNSQSLTGHFSSRFRSQSFLPPSSATPNLPPPHLSKLPPSQPSSLWSISHAHIPPSLLPPSLPLHLTSPHSPPVWRLEEENKIDVSYLIILGEQLGEFRIPPLRCFFLGERVDGCSSSTANTCTECQNIDRWLGTCAGPDLKQKKTNTKKKKIANSQSVIANKTKQKTQKETTQKKKKKTERKKRKINNSVSNWKKYRESISNGW